MKFKCNFKHGIIGSYFAMIYCIIIGFYKMFIYKNSEFSFEKKFNVYVGGDAYNYIINAGYSTSWFVLAGVFAVIGFTFVYVYYKNKE